jgi:hypothetical protein
MPRKGRCDRGRALLALGITSIPNEFSRRRYIRPWFSAANQGPSSSSSHWYEKVLEHRFVLGTKQMRAGQLRALQQEHAESGDLALLAEQRETKNHLSEKSLRWFVLAAEMFPCAQFVGKADPDTLLVWERLGVQLRLILSRRRALDRRVVVGTGFDWTSMLSNEAPGFPHACGCCGRSPKQAWGLQLQRSSAWGACDWEGRRSGRYASGGWSSRFNASLEGPFPYPFGTFYAVNQALARWLAGSAFVTDAIEAMAHDRWPGRMAFSEDLVFGWAASHAPNTSAVCFARGSFDNFDAARGMQAHHRLAPECFARHGLAPANFTTGAFSKWGACCAEFLTPRQIVAHHVENEGQWQRARLMAERWSAVQSEPCFYPSAHRIFRTSAAYEWGDEPVRSLPRAGGAGGQAPATGGRTAAAWGEF